MRINLGDPDTLRSAQGNLRHAGNVSLVGKSETPRSMVTFDSLRENGMLGEDKAQEIGDETSTVPPNVPTATMQC